ncbi:hypothetical protein BC939DRAFT_141917 [Gamsiella multidivaricata]|uniref:uncharacterized protein n=1 Tax=Gamsiella multidivaricata TaxID=101098 RepID=UPI00221FA02C|nr:uncharacterized protein BC939DRAFT_141917 [Gamsiella multidivaricata]KAG0367424.1 hypothetical protein BGZ54_003881 [Gamsiella multidivaricata]KAI7824329.1 hypothetical protein BC939DRAFT_141917 [Gamsiella multidivaricata]
MAISFASKPGDVYSAGVIFNEIMTRTAPYARQLQNMDLIDGSSQVLYMVKFEHQRLDLLLGDDSDESVDAVNHLICDCLQPEPYLRPDFSNILQRVRTISPDRELTGPVKQSKFLPMLHDLITGSSTPAELAVPDNGHRADEREEQLKTVHCLLVDDNLVSQKAISKILSRMGITPELANNGQEAVDKCRVWSAAIAKATRGGQEGHEDTLMHQTLQQNSSISSSWSFGCQFLVDLRLQPRSEPMPMA